MLTTTQLHGFNQNSNLLPNLVYVTKTDALNDASTYTYSSQSLGTESSDRIIVVAVVSRSASSGIQCNSVTVGGSSTTLVARTTTASNSSSIWTISYPTGTTADIVVTFDTTQVRSFIYILALYNKSSATVNASSAVNNLTGSTAVTAGTKINGCSVCFAFVTNKSTPVDPTVANLSKDFQTTYLDGSVDGVIYGYSQNNNDGNNASFALSNWINDSSAYQNSAIMATWAPD